MAQFHCNIKVYTRADGHSCVAAAAYQSRSALTNGRDGVRHDYRRCHEHEVLVADLGVFLPKRAPRRWLDRSTLWNEVESTERSANAQLARRIVLALPRELTRGEQIALATEIAKSFAADGMCADACLHDALDGHNPHLHLLLTLRSCDEEGFLPKSQNVYLVRGATMEEAAWASADEFKALQQIDPTCSKVYRYRIGGEVRELAPWQLDELDDDELASCKRIGKTPIQDTRYLNDWNDKENAVKWRLRVARLSNEALERHGSAERVSHLSYAARGIDKIPTVHEGYYVRKAEEEAECRAESLGIKYKPVTDKRCENERAKKANEYLRKLLEIARQLIEVIKAYAALIAEHDARCAAQHARKRQWNYDDGFGFGGGMELGGMGLSQ